MNKFAYSIYLLSQTCSPGKGVPVRATLIFDVFESLPVPVPPYPDCTFERVRGGGTGGGGSGSGSVYMQPVAFGEGIFRF